MEPQIYNQFSLSLVDRVIDRALGKDEQSIRIIGTRPADHVLAGFLTPTKPKENLLEVESLLDDLPQDSAYEQSAHGMEWLIPKSALTKTSLRVAIDFSLYVRCLPTYDEQHKEFSWNKTRDPNAEQSSAIIPVWTRIDIPTLIIDIDLTTINQNKKIESLQSAVQDLWSQHYPTISGLYPSAQEVNISLQDFSSQESYETWKHRQSPSASALRQYNWAPEIDVRIAPVPTEKGCMRLSLRILNRTPWRDPKQCDFFDPNIYATHLTVTLPKTAHQPMEFADLPKSYRYDRTIAAVGINCDIRAEEKDHDSLILSTQSVPRKRVDRLEPNKLSNAEPTFLALMTDPAPILQRVLEEMKRYDSTSWQQKIENLSEVHQIQEAQNDRYLFRENEIKAFERGMALLDDPRYPFVKQAFCLMNETMQKVAAGAYDQWRLFQLVFIVIQIPRLAARHYEEITQPGDEDVDILWFAAGGGKTEAFLGLLVWQMFFDRLRGKNIGVTAFIRFPLRLLTFQQLQRVARFLAQAELIRKREKLAGARFSLGYFVGDNTRPNRIDDTRHVRFIANKEPDPSLRSLTRCPFCNSDIKLDYNQKLRQVEHHCVNETICPGGKTPLPIYIVDADIFRYLPTVIVSTVDKLALIGQNPRFGQLFGRFDVFCEYHGASFLNTNKDCMAAKNYRPHEKVSGVHSRACGAYRVSYGPFIDPSPSLLIQDELHLLSEEMGVFDSHYETAALTIMQSLGQKPWKIIAATATIENFEQHARHLYLKAARQFPCPGPGAYDSFYYHVEHNKIGRIFVGVLGVGRKHTPAVTRLLSLIYQELQTARDKAADNIEDAYTYYHLPPLDSAQFDRLVFYYELVLTYVLTRKGSDQVAEAIESRVKRELQETMPNHANLQVETLNGGVDVIEMIETMEKIETAQETAPIAERVRGVVATNIISHGVDVARFNIMVFGGFTRLVAEYIQASARVGRTYPGISFFVATPQSERDRSIFQRFSKMHEFIDRMVDPSAINRWPVQALERTVPGVLHGYLSIVAAEHLQKHLTTVGAIINARGDSHSECLNETEIVRWMEQAFGVNQAPYGNYEKELSRIVRNKYAQIINAAPEVMQGYDYIRDILNPMRSLRDVDDPAYISITIPKEVSILRTMLRPSRS